VGPELDGDSRVRDSQSGPERWREEDGDWGADCDGMGGRKGGKGYSIRGRRRQRTVVGGLPVMDTVASRLTEGSMPPKADMVPLRSFANLSVFVWLMADGLC
jgi:hypothetical protein